MPGKPPSSVWAVIPARGGSVGVPRKNLRVIGGVPLIARTIRTALEVLGGDRVVVVTDDREIEAISREVGATVVFESDATPPGETLDTKILRNLPRLRAMGAQDDDIVLTLQPTSPLLPGSAIAQAAEILSGEGAASVLTVTDSRHLEWTRDADGNPVPAYEARVNRQSLPARYRETGGVIGARLADIERTGTRVIEPVSLIELDSEQGLDIDSFADLYSAAHLLTRLRIAIRTDAAPALGMGHAYRSLAIATELARHEVRIYTQPSMPLGGQFFSRFPYRHVSVTSDEDFVDQIAQARPDLVVLDVLDTSDTLMKAIRESVPGIKIVTFEDQGTGAPLADLVISEFLPLPDDIENALTGIDNAILAPAFDIMSAPREMQPTVENIVVLFGGTDPAGLANRALDSLERVGNTATVTVVRGLGASPVQTGDRPFEVQVLTDVAYMPGVLRHADFAYTSAGRTVIELAQMGVPSIGLAQNVKELGHVHALPQNGVDMLGLGTTVDDAMLDAATHRMLTDHEHRSRLRSAALGAIAGRSNRRTLGRIFDLLGFDPFPNL